MPITRFASDPNWPTGANRKKKTSGAAKRTPADVYLAGSDPYRPVRIQVQIGLQGDDYTEVTSGIKAGDKVLIRTKSLKPKAQTDDNADEDDSAAS
jgi:HlyD family secretion protein